MGVAKGSRSNKMSHQKREAKGTEGGGTLPVQKAAGEKGVQWSRGCL